MSRQQQSTPSAYFKPRISDEEYQQQIEMEVKQQEEESKENALRERERTARKRLRESTTEQARRRPGRPRKVPASSSIQIDSNKDNITVSGNGNHINSIKVVLSDNADTTQAAAELFQHVSNMLATSSSSSSSSTSSSTTSSSSSSHEFLDWLKTSYPTFHPLFIPAGCTSKAQPADVVLQRPLKHEFSSHYSQWMTNEVSDLLKAGAQPEQIKVDVGLHRMKPLLVKWMMLSWRALSENREMIKKGWGKAGMGKVMQADFQLESMNMIVNKELSLNSESQPEDDQSSAADIEERYEDVILDNEDEAADDEEEVNINDALVAFIEARPVVGVRRSARLQQSESQRADYVVASLLQNEILQDAVRV